MRLDSQLGLRKLKGLHAHILYPCEVEVLWDLLEPFFASSIHHSKGTISLEGVKATLHDGRCQATVLMDDDEIVAVFAGRIVDYDSYKSYRIIAAAGRQMKEALARIDVLTSWAFSQGCVELEGWCRPAIARMLRPAGFQPKFTMVTLDLRRKLQ